MIFFILIGAFVACGLGFAIGHAVGRSGVKEKVIEKIVRVEVPIRPNVREMKPPKQGYEYLGETEYYWHVVGKPSEKIEVYFGHFWANPNDIDRGRAVTVVEALQTKGYQIQGVDKTRTYYESVPNWLAGGNLWSGIERPSPWLKDYTLKKYGREWDGKKWLDTKDKPLPALPNTLTADVIDILSQRKEK